MRFLGVDYGEKKIGLAISDEKAEFAFPCGVIDNVSSAVALEKIKRICNDGKISKVIVGQSLDYNKKPNIIMKRVNNFKIAVEEKLNIRVAFENEVLTTKQAERFSGKNDKTHASAAALILQSYLDKKNMIK